MLQRLRRILLAVIICVTTAIWAQSPIAVVHGHLSIPAGERRYAASLASHIARWYQLSGVKADIVDDQNLDAALTKRKLAILVYCSQPQAAQREAINRYLDRGGKIMVFYCASAPLAQRLGIQLLGYQKATDSKQWSRMAFDPKKAPQGTPIYVAQRSPNIYRARPAQASSQTIAYWLDQSGRKTADPAWIVTPYGYWMTHVLTGDGDEEAKRLLLIALTSRYVPSIWASASRALYDQAVAPLRNQSLAKRLAAIKSGSVRVSLQRRYNEIAAQANQLHGRMQSQANATTLAHVKLLQETIDQLYGATFFPRAGEIIAVWDHSGQGLYPGDWPRTIKALADAGITDLYINVAGAGFAHYPSSILPRSPVYERYGDQVAACLAAAKRHRIRIHAWILLYSTTSATPERIKIFQQKGWTLQTIKGQEMTWLDPSQVAVQDYLTKAATELASRYPLHGIHLDFVRYPGFWEALGPRSKARFEASIGQSAAPWPQSVSLTGALRKPFITWRAKLITDTVQRIRFALRRTKPHLTLSTAVYGKYPACIDSVGQNWQSWQRMGLIDYALPMNYTTSTDQFTQWLTQQTQSPHQARQIIPGIGITAAESRLTPIQMLDQIAIARSRGCPGFALFDLDDSLLKQFLPILKQGISR